MTREEAEWLTEGIIDALIMDDIVVDMYAYKIIRIDQLEKYLVEYLQEIEIKENHDK